MNQYNNDGYEIIDSNTSPCPPNTNRNNQYSRYPYANNPNQPFHHTNYKDWIDVSQSSEPYSNNCPTNSTSSDWSAATSTALIVVGTILSASSLPASVPALIISAGTLIPMLWPQGNVDTNSVWRNFIYQGNKISCESAAAVEPLVLAKLAELNKYFQTYKIALENWKKQPNNPAFINEVAFQFRNTAMQINGAMTTFSMPNYEVAYLSVYAQAALLHLTLLYEGILYENEWQLGFNAGDLYRNQLKDLIRIYINYCQTFYKKGLDQLYNTPNIKWEAYNKYRQEYTVSVLNVISCFPTFNLNVYNPDIPIKKEFTQQLFTTTPELQDIQNTENIALIEKTLIPSLDLVTFLRTLTLYTRKDELTNSINYLNGIRNVFQYTNNPNNSFTNNYGNTTDPNNFPAEHKVVGSTQAYYFCDVVHHSTENLGIRRGIRGINFMDLKLKTNNTTTTTVRYDSNSLSKDSTVRTLLPFPANVQSTSMQNNQYILSRITMSPNMWKATFNADTYIYGFIWTHSSVNLTNSISSTNQYGRKIITQISAVKANQMTNINPTGGYSVIAGPGHTGGNLVKLTKFQDNIKITCKFIDIAQYKIRIRYANNIQNASLKLTIHSGNNVIKDYSLPLLNTGLNPNTSIIPYENFYYIETNDTFQSSLNTDYNIYLEHRASGSTTIIIDKIEFIPQ